jgi:hypothetical protein
LIDGALYCAAREDGGEVEQCARDARAGDAADRVDVAWQQRRAGVGVDAGSLASSAPR